MPPLGMPPKKPAKEEAPEEVGEARIVGPGESLRKQGSRGRSADGTRGKLSGRLADLCLWREFPACKLRAETSWRWPCGLQAAC